MKIGILGYGYTAKYFSDMILNINHNYKIWATTRNTPSNTHPNIKLINFDFNKVSKNIENTDIIIISTPPNKDGSDPSLSLTYDLLIQNKKNIKLILYLSSTGVYGNHDGQWVTESSTCQPDSLTNKNRLCAEDSWLSLYNQNNLPVMIFRLSGIYGPGRNAIDKIQQGKTNIVLKKNQLFSRIHVTDICQCLITAINNPMPGEIFNISDDLPCNIDMPYNYAAKLLQVSPPEYIPYNTTKISDRLNNFYKNNKQVSNFKLKEKLLSNLKYPTYKEGLDDIFNLLEK